MNLQAQFTAAAQEATRKIFITLLNLPFEFTPAVPAEFVSGDMLGIINVTGPLSGSISVCMPQALTIKMAEAFTHTRVAELNPYVYATVGEFTNMMVGNIKTELSTDTQDAFELGLPIVLTGKVGTMHPGTKSVQMVVPVQVGSETLFITGLLKSENDSRLA